MLQTCSNCGQKNRVPVAHLGKGICGKCHTALGQPSKPIDADAAVFDEVVRDARVPVLVDFWAAWCGPCRAAAPKVAGLATELSGRALVLKVDTERHPDLAARYNVTSIPNFVVLKDGRVVRQQPGLVDQAVMKGWLEAAGA